MCLSTFSRGLRNDLQDFNCKDEGNLGDNLRNVHVTYHFAKNPQDIRNSCSQPYFG